MKLKAFIFISVGFLASSLVPSFSFLARRGKRICTSQLFDASNDKALLDLRTKLDESDFPAAFQILKRNPMIPMSMEEGRVLLNNLDKFITDKDEAERIRIMITECAPLVYRRLSRQNALRGFSSADEAYPEESPDISPARLEDITGLSITALTPKQRQTYWRLITFGLISFEFVLGSSIGIDPLYTFIPATFFLFGLDQLAFKGACFDTVYRLLFRDYEKKVIAHEAGHFLVSYLLGLSVADCVTNGWDSRKYSEIKGQAGTVFLDPRFMDEMAKQKVTRSSLDRLSIVLMGGIAAEALMFGNAEGGKADEQSLFNLLANVQPPWNILRIQGQARWAVVQAFLLLKEHEGSFRALVTALEKKDKIGDCIVAIEENLPTVLPSSIRLVESELKKKKSLRMSLAGYVSRLSRKVGGLLPIAQERNITNIVATSDGFVSLLGGGLGVPSDNRDADEPLSVQQEGDLTSKVRDLGRSLANAIEAQKDAEVIEKPSQDGGIWLNGLQSYRKKAPMGTRTIRPQTLVQSTTEIESPSSASQEGMPTSSIGEISDIPLPLPGYEQRIRDMEVRLEVDRMVIGIDEVRNLTIAALCSSSDHIANLERRSKILKSFEACEAMKVDVCSLMELAAKVNESDLLDSAIGVEEMRKRVLLALGEAVQSSVDVKWPLNTAEEEALSRIYQSLYADRSAASATVITWDNKPSSASPYTAVKPEATSEKEEDYDDDVTGKGEGLPMRRALPAELLITHRGFQMRRLENMELYYSRKTKEIEARVQTMKKKKTSAKTNV